MDSSTKAPFSFDTIENFDEHIDLSIPDFGKLREIVLNLSSYFLRDQGRVYDIGCSTGLLLSKLNHQYQNPTLQLVGLDKSDNLLGRYAQRADNLAFLGADVTDPAFELESSCLVLSLFTLQFIPLRARAELLTKIYRALEPGGALILAEKIFLPSGYMQDVFTFSHYDYKRESFSAQQILDKQADLRRLMHPQSEQQNIELLSEAGFRSVTPFWQSLLFKAWVCLK